MKLYLGANGLPVLSVPNASKGKCCDSTGDQFSHRMYAAHVTDRPLKSKLTVGLQIKATKGEENNGRRNHRGYIKKASVSRKYLVDGKQETPRPEARVIRP
jgi:hypothetical protein